LIQDSALLEISLSDIKIPHSSFPRVKTEEGDEERGSSKEDNFTATVSSNII
jgi:hypothetical protein